MKPRIGRRLAVGAVAITGLLSGPVLGAAAADDPAPPAAVKVAAAASSDPVNPAVIGHAYLWPFGGMRSFGDGKFYDAFLDQLQNGVKPGSLRFPGGITGEIFHWKRAIGPQARRTANAFGPTNGPSETTVGPDEFGALLDRTGATGVMTVNFGTGTAQEAADLVRYMLDPEDSSRWADLRARNGHPAPYDIPYWEVGNEASAANYWRTGTPVEIGGPPGACSYVPTCLYIYGGSTQFASQPLVRYADRTPAASYSQGEPDERFYVAYPPVRPETMTVTVGGATWTRVERLADFGPEDPVYVVDSKSGEIAFGDGVHGAIPTAGEQVVASYVSGPQDGFLEYYDAMKAANSGIDICAGIESSDFIVSMGSSEPYDCMEHHTYVSAGSVANSTEITDYQHKIMGVADQQGTFAAALQNTVEQHAQREVPLVLTEYGQLLSSNPNGYPYFHMSLDQALLNATQLANWIRLGIPVANRQILTGVIPPPDQCCLGLPGAAPNATTAAIGTPGPRTVLEATGMVYGLFEPFGNAWLMPVEVSDNPVITIYDSKPVYALSVLAARGDDGLHLLVINRSTTDAVHSQVSLAGVSGQAEAQVHELNAASSLSFNTVDEPNAVRITDRTLTVTDGVVDTMFPAHSVTQLTIPSK